MVDSNIMKTETLSTKCRVNHCSQCPEDTEFYCETCKHSLFLNCKEIHVMSLDTLHHDVVIKQETCIRHPKRIYEQYCKSCELPVCSQCENHKQHKILDIKEAYETNRQQHKEIIRNIRSELLYISCFLQAKIHSDKKKLCKEIYDHLTLMSTKAQRIKNLIDDVICDVTIRYSCKMIYRLLKQRTKIKRHLTILEIFDQKTEQHTKRSLECLSFMKNISRNKMMATCFLTKQAFPSLNTKVNIEDLTEGLGEIRIIDQTGKRKIENKCLLKLMPTPVLQKTVAVRGISSVNHISTLTSERAWVSEQAWNTERIWVSDDDDIYSTNTAGDVMCHVTDVLKESWWGIHSVTSDGELIYIDKEGNIDSLQTIT
ncbi:tripartite motif-containing protein 54-like [Saccostrea cucullata]|uniref:tripartite motif-containing protein 54-like n=1 Tax=Saccostrea cuccullata TaxID=36930 RepID=UPI002ED6622A